VQSLRKGHGRHAFYRIQHDNDATQDERLSNCEQNGGLQAPPFQIAPGMLSLRIRHNAF